MGYLVITHVETIEEANILVNSQTPAASARVAGVYRMPDRDEPVCPGASGGCKEVGWTRSRRGHMVHTCGLRNPRYRDWIANSLLDMFGINLLPRNKTQRVFQNPQGWGR